MVKKLIMRICALLILLVISVIGPVSADPARWIVRDKDTTIILFGTLHALKPGTSWLSRLMREDMRQVDVLFLEADPKETSPEILTPLVQQHGLLPSPLSLNERIGDTMTLATRQAGVALGLDTRRFDGMRLWFIGSTLASATFQQLGYDQKDGVEQGLIRIIEETGGSVMGLETIASQIALFGGLSLEEEHAVLADTLDQIDDADAFLTKLSSAYVAGDVDGVAGILNTSFAKTPGLYDKAIVARNRDWALKIEQLLEERPGVFAVAVGSGHLAGDNSLIDFLNLLAITVDRLER